MVQSHHHKVGPKEGALSFTLLFPSSCFPPFPSQRSNPSSTANDSMYLCSRASQVVLVVKNPPANVGEIRDSGFNPWVGKIPWRRAWQPTSVFLPGESPWTEEPGSLQSMGSESTTQHTGGKITLGFIKEVREGGHNSWRR